MGEGSVWAPGASSERRPVRGCGACTPWHWVFCRFVGTGRQSGSPGATESLQRIMGAQQASEQPPVGQPGACYAWNGAGVLFGRLRLLSVTGLAVKFLVLAKIYRKL